MTLEETNVTRKNFGPSFSPVTKGKSMINQPFQHLKYETKVTGFFLVQVEISVTKVMNGKYTESDDSRWNKGNEKKFWAIFFLVTNVTKGKSIINHLFQHLKYETKETGFFLVHFRISVTKVTNGKYIESDDSRRNKRTKKNSGSSFSPVTNGTKGKSIINQSFQHLQYETKITGFFLVQVEISITKVMKGKYTEKYDSRRNKGNEKKFWAIFFPVTNVIKSNEGKINDKSAFSTFKIWNQSNRSFLVHVEISITKVMNGKYTESDDSWRNKGNEKKFWAIFFLCNQCNKHNEGKINDKSAFSWFKIWNESNRFFPGSCRNQCNKNNKWKTHWEWWLQKKQK